MPHGKILYFCIDSIHSFLPQPSFALSASRMGLRDAPTILPTFFPFLSLATRHSPCPLPALLSPSLSSRGARDLLCFAACTFVGANYVTLNIGRKLVLEMAASALVQWTIACLVIGLIYKPVFPALR